jgi:hypothetical protein
VTIPVGSCSSTLTTLAAQRGDSWPQDGDAEGDAEGDGRCSPNVALADASRPDGSLLATTVIGAGCCLGRDVFARGSRVMVREPLSDRSAWNEPAARCEAGLFGDSGVGDRLPPPSAGGGCLASVDPFPPMAFVVAVPRDATFVTTTVQRMEKCICVRRKRSPAT